MTAILLILQERLIRSISTIPSYSSLGWMVILLLVYSLFAFSFGFGTKFLQWDICKSNKLALKIAATSLIFPAIFEEILFRVLFLPYPSDSIQTSTWFIWSLWGLFIFIICHPLNAFTFFPERRATFSDPIFLCLAGVLGLVCTLTYWQSGSLWPPVFIHWFVVVIWLLCFGGLAKLNFES